MTVEVRMSPGSVMLLGLLQEQLNAFKEKLANRRQALLNSVQAVAFDWSVNFASEGGNVGGWAGLSDRTLRERAADGYASGPILRRSGTLYDSAIANFASATRGFSTTQYNPYRSGSAAAIFTQLALQDGGPESPGIAHLELGGYPATANQEGTARTPARPIWYVDDAVSSQVRSTVEEWLVELAKEF